jgi:hypothetical protein
MTDESRKNRHREDLYPLFVSATVRNSYPRTVRNSYAATNKMFKAVFSMLSVPRLYEKKRWKLWPVEDMSYL